MGASVSTTFFYLFRDREMLELIWNPSYFPWQSEISFPYNVSCRITLLLYRVDCSTSHQATSSQLTNFTKWVPDHLEHGRRNRALRRRIVHIHLLGRRRVRIPGTLHPILSIAKKKSLTPRNANTPPSSLSSHS